MRNIPAGGSAPFSSRVSAAPWVGPSASGARTFQQEKRRNPHAEPVFSIDGRRAGYMSLGSRRTREAVPAYRWRASR